MKTYFSIIARSQNILLGLSILILATLPAILIFFPDSVSTTTLYFGAHTSLFFVMVIRPLADLCTNVRFIRPLVILRKGVGVFSASIIVSFLLVKLITDPSIWLQTIVSSQYWSLQDFAFFAHIADFSAILLLITSNNLSKKLLGVHWKRLQRLSYVYFYGSGLYVVFVLHDYLVLTFMVIVTVLTVLAWKHNHDRTKAAPLTV